MIRGAYKKKDEQFQDSSETASTATAFFISDWPVTHTGRERTKEFIQTCKI
jgi:hypothetical protein